MQTVNSELQKNIHVSVLGIFNYNLKTVETK